MNKWASNIVVQHGLADPKYFKLKTQNRSENSVTHGPAICFC